jgi:putative hydrolase of the HAD superfamily
MWRMRGTYARPHASPGRSGIARYHPVVPILFDLDDTLLDDYGGQEVYLKALYARHRANLPFDAQAQFNAAWRAAIERHHDRYLAGEISLLEQRRARVREVFGRPEMPDVEVDLFVTEFLVAYEASWRLFDDVLPTLDALGSATLGLITNGSHEQQMKKLERTGIADRFSVVVFSDTVGHAKPAPEIFHHACAQLGCAPGDCVFVGDDWARDIAGARGAGMTPIWLRRRRAGSAGAREDVTTIETLAQLVAHLRSTPRQAL